MKKKFKLLAGMAVCVLGVLSTSSCSKDEFFGLEGAEVISPSAKYEIAMSTEFTDYANAYFDVLKELNQSVDTTEMKFYGIVKGKPVYVKNGSCSTVLESLNKLKSAFPILEDADNIDFEEIMTMALAYNENLRGFSSNNIPQKKSKTKSYGGSQARSWLKDLYYRSGLSVSNSGDTWRVAQGGIYWDFRSFSDQMAAVYDAISYSESNNIEAGGFFWGDGSAVSMVTPYGEAGWMCWPGWASHGSPYSPESDFHIHPSGSLDPSTFDFSSWAGDGMGHFIFNYEGYYSWFWT